LVLRVVYPWVVALAGIPFVGLNILRAVLARDGWQVLVLVGPAWLLMLTWTIVRGRRFKEVWLNGEILEVQTRQGITTIPLADISMVELTHWYDKPRRIRVRYRTAAQQGVVEFIPIDAGVMFGGGEQTASELRRLVQHAHT
jgi:hypothetical protein